MRILANKQVKTLLIGIMGVGIGFALLSQFLLWLVPFQGASIVPGVSLLSVGLMLWLLWRYFQKQDEQLENAVLSIEQFLSGDRDARIASNEEGELCRLFHAINTLAQVLSAKAAKEASEKSFLKDTISDISHQLKTPLAALNIYNGLLQEETAENPSIEEFVSLSEKELDRIETLVQNLLKITKLDAGTLSICKERENVAEMMRDIELHFDYRAKQEGKTLLLSGQNDVFLNCDRDWMTEAVENLVKNALDHTEQGDTITIRWRQNSGMVNIQVSDTGCGIHPEDIYHIFKRFYRSRYSKDLQGVGLGLPLAKAIVEEHRGTIEVDSEVGKGSTFSMSFLTYPTEM